MKKRKALWLLPAAALLFLLCACGQEPGEEISRTLGVDLSAGVLAEHRDTHGGFLGDGETFLQLTFDQESAAALEEEISQAKGWQPLPLPDDLVRVLYGEEYEEGDTVYSYAPLAAGQDGEPLFPRVERGSCFFLDRHSESTDPYDASQLDQRYSYNFTVAVYDSESRTLYCFEMDT